MRCDVSSDGMPCLEPAAAILVLAEFSRLNQGQAPSPRCEAHAQQATAVLTESIVAHTLVPIPAGAEDADPAEIVRGFASAGGLPERSTPAKRPRKRGSK